MLDKTTVSAIAAELGKADRDRVPVVTLSSRYPGLSIEDAYAVQNTWREKQLDHGHRQVGYKVGLTSKSQQDHAGMTEPNYGVLFHDTVYYNASLISFDRFLDVRIEAELAFILRDPLEGPNCTMFDVLRATEYVTPALEIVTSHYDTESNNAADIIADNAYCGGLVLGGHPVEVGEADLRWLSALLYKNESIEDTGVAAGILNHPAISVAWLANKLSEYDLRIEPGEIVLAGAFTRPMWVERGDNVLCDYNKLGTITCRFI